MLLFVVIQECTSHVQSTFEPVNLLVSKAPLLHGVLPLQCFFCSLDIPTVEPGKEKRCKKSDQTALYKNKQTKQKHTSVENSFF